MLLNLILCLFITFILNSFIKKVSSFFIILLALIIFNVEILGIIKLLNSNNLIIIEFIELCISIIFLKLLKIEVYVPDCKSILEKIFFALKSDKFLLIMCISWSLMIIISLYYSCSLPISRVDDLSYHLYRPIQFAIQSSISMYISPDVRNTLLPVNSELIYTWMYLFCDNYILFRFLQFFSYIFGIISLFNLMKLFNINVRKILWTIFILSSIVKFQHEIYGTETDIVVGSVVVSSLLFFFYFIKTHNYKMLYISSLSLAIAIGVKTTALICVCLLLPLYLLILFKTKKIKEFSIFSGFLFVNFIIFSSYIYILNYLNWNNILTNEAFWGFNHLWGGMKAWIANIIRYVFDFIDLFGTQYYEQFESLLKSIEKKIFSVFHIPYNIGTFIEFIERPDLNINQYGINAFLGFVVSIFVTFKFYFKRKKSKYLVLINYCVYFFIFSILLFSASMSYMEANKRYLIPYLFLSAPILSIIYTPKNTVLKFMITATTIYYLAVFPFVYINSPIKEIILNCKATNLSLCTQKDNINSVFNKNYDYLTAFVTQNINKNDKIGIIFPYSILNTHLADLSFRLGFTVEQILLYEIENINLSKYKFLITDKELEQISMAIKPNKMMKQVINNSNSYDCGWAYRVLDKNFSSYESLLFKEYSKTTKYKHFQGLFCKTNEIYLIKNNFEIYDKLPEPYNLVIWKNNQL